MRAGWSWIIVKCGQVAATVACQRAGALTSAPCFERLVRLVLLGSSFSQRYHHLATPHPSPFSSLPHLWSTSLLCAAPYTLWEDDLIFSRPLLLRATTVVHLCNLCGIPLPPNRSSSLYDEIRFL